MKTEVLIFLLVFAVSSSQIITPEYCIQKYAKDCVVPLINQWKDSMECSVLVPFTRCIANVSTECDRKDTPVLNYLANLLQDACYPDEAKIQEWKTAAECLVNQTENLETCVRNLPDDICADFNSTIKSIIECPKSTVQEVCIKVVDVAMDIIIGFFEWLHKACPDSEGTGHFDPGQCIMQNVKSFASCKLTGEFNKLGDICSSIKGLTDCVVETSEKTCGNETTNLIQAYTDGLTFGMELCTDIKLIDGITVPECDKGIIKCNVDLLNLGEVKCTDVSNYISCMADAGKKCAERENPLYVIILEKYKSKFPEYCNKDSSFNKNLQDQAGCISEKVREVLSPCVETLEKNHRELKTDDVTGKLRIIVNFLHCVTEGYRERCSNEAAGAVNDVLHPLGDSLDESCRMLTGKKCNGACAMQVATWMFISALTYLLTRRFE